MPNFRCLPGPEPRLVEKQCTKCQEWLPCSTRHYKRDHKSERRLSSWCIECHRTASREQQRRLRAADPGRAKATQAEWMRANPERAKAIADRATAKQRSTPVGILNARMRSGLSHSLRAVGVRKDGRRWEALAGYTAATLRGHIERQFTKGMSWQNAGEWHVDHIQPLSSFRYASEDDPEFRAAWALSNLRPLWAADNLKK